MTPRLVFFRRSLRPRGSVSQRPRRGGAVKRRSRGGSSRRDIRGGGLTCTHLSAAIIGVLLSSCHTASLSASLRAKLFLLYLSASLPTYLSLTSNCPAHYLCRRRLPVKWLWEISSNAPKVFFFFFLSHHEYVSWSVYRLMEQHKRLMAARPGET